MKMEMTAFEIQTRDMQTPFPHIPPKEASVVAESLD